jgi:hypothetical protein
MDDRHFDALTRSFIRTLSRRRLTGLLGGAGMGALGLFGVAPPATAACKKKCGPCERCKNDKCKPKQDDIRCNGDGRCLKGRCNSRPDCFPFASTCSVDDPDACCSGICRSNKCMRGEMDARCRTGEDCISGKCVGYRCRGKLDCATKPNGTQCAVNRACQNGSCVACWNYGEHYCCRMDHSFHSCVAPASCEADQCVVCQSDVWCEDRCVAAACENDCLKSCTSPADCCGDLSCVHMPEQGDPNKHRCAPA